MTKKKDQGEYLNPINEHIYSYFDEFLVGLDLYDEDVRNFIENECNYLEYAEDKVVDSYYDGKRGYRWNIGLFSSFVRRFRRKLEYETTLKVFKCPDGSFWGYETTFYPFHDSHTVNKAGKVKKETGVTVNWEFV